MRAVALCRLLAVANVLLWVRHPILVAKFHKRFHRLPDIASPRIQPERLLWRKIFDRNPLYRQMLDKLAVRELARARCPDIAWAEIVWVGTDARTIPDALIGSDYVIKTNNGSDRNVFPDAATDRAELDARLERWLRTPYGVGRGEWAYRDIPPAVLVERKIVAPAGEDLVELNCQVAMGRCFLVGALLNVKKPGLKRGYFDREGRRLPFRPQVVPGRRPAADLPRDFRLPDCFDTVIRHAEAIARDCDYVRVDFLCAGGKAYFNECTVFQSSGYDRLPDNVEPIFAAHWDLRNAWFMRRPPRGPLGWYAAIYRLARDRAAL